MKKIPIEFLDDIVKVFLLGRPFKTKSFNGVSIPDIIARPHEPEVNYIVEWEDLFKIRKIMIEVMLKQKDRKFRKLAKAIKAIHAKETKCQLD